MYYSYTKEYAREYRQKNIDKIRKRAREWARKNRPPYSWDELAKERQRRYRAKHKSKLALKRKIYLKKRLESDPNYRLKWLLRSRVNIAIKRNLTSKAYKTTDLLGCSIQQARKHLERQFTQGMSWKNHGVWEIDHIIPIFKFDLCDPEQQKKAFHYTNLQPLMKSENRSKGAKVR